MKIGFFWQYINETSRSHLELAKKMLASAKSVMPDVEVWQLTDDTSDVLEGVDGVYRIGGKLPMAVRRMTHNASVSGDWLFIDSDIIIQKDVRHVFDDPFDVALTNRDGTITNEADFAKVMPYNLGVSFSRCPSFWVQVIKHMQKLPLDLQHWMGDQRIICEMIKQDSNPEFDILILPGKDFNYPPKFAGDGKQASICHYKGPRKQFLEVA